MFKTQRTNHHRPRRHRAKKAGLPPGSLVYVGEVKTPVPALSVIEYDDTGLAETHFPDLAAWRAHQSAHATRWLNLYGLQDATVMREIGTRYQLHPLVQEDILNTDQRPKVESYGDYLFVVARYLSYDADTLSVSSDQVSLVLARNTVLSFQEQSSGTFEPVRERLRSARGQIRKLGADYLAYALLDALVDQYFVVLEQLSVNTEELEDALLDKPNQASLQTLHQLRRATHNLRRAVWPLREVLNTMIRNEEGFFQPGTGVYLRDVYDHTVHIVESIEALRDLQAGMLDIYLSSLSNRFNIELRALTVITTLFMPATLVTGIFGMNFKHMPVLDLPHGFGLALGLMATIALIMVAIFWRRNWLR
ncbi:magnesium transport protein CorA [Sulfuriferula plumbiphila]|uniref:Magnesium transport protein CorA n=1 Tax=Sulfuriferula plumbiphila TaxID=171865 RepID=A0A512L460_9PROT|nr:magnesium/cobalt transporter CorA [Sulfuriferula plumbiphila]BBP05451.1 magnesium transport protein CorA [Sulfuriferula plumbiphila]GEP29252.1 magnesium transport protein CorA [Sulfuriferula plumbiphila]